MPKVKLHEKSFPAEGIAHRLTNDLIVEKGNYLVMADDGSSVVTLTPDEFNQFYHTTRATNGKKGHTTIERRWTPADQKIVEYLASRGSWVHQSPINHATGFDPGRVNSRLQFLEHHGYATLRRQNGRREWMVTDLGRARIREPVQQSLNHHAV